jgi:Holliday junction resolvase
MNTYAKGREFEHWVQRFLEAKGYFVVRSAASKSPCDLVAIRQVGRERPLLVQCKRGSKGMSQGQRLQFAVFVQRSQCQAVLASRKDRQGPEFWLLSVTNGGTLHESPLWPETAQLVEE